MKNPLYVLPTLEFIGGETHTYIWNLWHLGPNERPNMDTPYNASGQTVTFSLINFSDQYGNVNEPIISKRCELRQNEDGVSCIAVTYLAAEETKELAGKYIYQLTVTNSAGEAEIPGKGIMFINWNIDNKLIGTTDMLMAKRYRAMKGEIL